MLTEDFLNHLNANSRPDVRANCFNAVELFWKDSSAQQFTGPEEFVAYVSKNFSQIRSDEGVFPGDVSIVWSRNSLELPIGKIILQDLFLKRAGYPFGLIIEHAFINLESDRVFQKPDPNPKSLYEVIQKAEAVAPYLKAIGYELTLHRRV